LNTFWKRQDELEQRLRHQRPPAPDSLLGSVLRRIDATRTRRERSFRLGLAGAVSVGMLVTLGTFGGLGYAASSVRHAVKAAVHVVAPAKPTPSSQPQLSSAAAQYGNKQAVCAVTPNGKQHTIVISENAVPNYLRTHPQAYLGSCGAFRPKGSKPNVCLRLGSGKFVPVWVKPSVVPAYLKRTFKAHRTTTGRC
jgi:hypothetical protein